MLSQLTIKPRCSSQWLTVSALIHAGVLCFVVVNSLSVPVKFGLVLLVLGSWLRLVWQHVFPSAGAIKKLCYDEGSWSLVFANGRKESVELLADSVLTPWALFLHFKSEHQRHHMLLLNDAAQVDELRRLRIILKIIWPARRLQAG